MSKLCNGKPVFFGNLNEQRVHIEDVNTCSFLKRRGTHCENSTAKAHFNQFSHLVQFMNLCYLKWNLKLKVFILCSYIEKLLICVVVVLKLMF